MFAGETRVCEETFGPNGGNNTQQITATACKRLCGTEASSSSAICTAFVVSVQQVSGCVSVHCIIKNSLIIYVPLYSYVHHVSHLWESLWAGICWYRSFEAHAWFASIGNLFIFSFLYMLNSLFSHFFIFLFLYMLISSGLTRLHLLGNAGPIEIVSWRMMKR